MIRQTSLLQDTNFKGQSGDTWLALSSELRLEWKSELIKVAPGGLDITRTQSGIDISIPPGEGWIRLAWRLTPANRAALLGCNLLFMIESDNPGREHPIKIYQGIHNRQRGRISDIVETTQRCKPKSGVWTEFRGLYFAAPATETQGCALVMDLPMDCTIHMAAADILRMPLDLSDAAAATLAQDRSRAAQPPVLRTRAAKDIPALTGARPVFSSLSIGKTPQNETEFRGWVMAGGIDHIIMAIGGASRPVPMDWRVMIEEGIFTPTGCALAYPHWRDLIIDAQMGLALPPAPDAAPGDATSQIFATLAIPERLQHYLLDATLGTDGLVIGRVFNKSAATAARQWVDVVGADGTVVASVQADEPAMFRDEDGSLTQGAYRFQIALSPDMIRNSSVTIRLRSAPEILQVLDLPGTDGVMGQIETIHSDAITGWAMTRGGDTRAVNVMAILDGRIIGKAEAGKFRTDLTKTLRSGGFHGFEMKLETSLDSDMLKRLVLRVAENGTVLFGDGLPEPDPQTCLVQLDEGGAQAGDAPAMPPKGHIDRINATGVAGWAAMPSQPEASCTVGLYVNGNLIKTVLADAPRGDIARALGTHGRNGFHFGFPPGLEIPDESEIAVTILPDGISLHGSQARYTPETTGFSHEIDPEIHAARLTQHCIALPDPAVAPTLRSVAIIMLNRDGAPYLRDLFESFAAHNRYPDYRMVVVDHGSTDDSMDECSAWADKLNIEVIQRGGNFSFSASNNFAADLAQEDVVFFLNNDIIVDSCILTPLMRHLEDDTVGAVGMRLVTPETDGETNTLVPGFVQHLGVKFGYAPQRPAIAAYELPGAPSRDSIAHTPWAVPAVTGAALAMRRSDFETLGGFDERFFYGYEDVDLCLGVAQNLGKRVISANEISAYHIRGATRTQETFATRQRYARNFDLLNARFGAQMRQDMRTDALAGGLFFRDQGFRIAFAVSTTDLAAPEADMMTAWELGESLARDHGWDVTYLNPDEWYDLDTFDAIVAMRPDWNPRNITSSGRDLIRIGWVRNWFDRWLQLPWLRGYDMIWAASELATNAFRSRVDAPVELVRIGANHIRFSPDNAPVEDMRTDYCFTGSFFDAPRDILSALDPQMMKWKFGIFGHNWDRIDWLWPNWQGPVPYPDMPSIYASTNLVIDDSNSTVKLWGSVNSRVFDALATGTLVLTNGAAGADEAFDGLLPVWKNREDLHRLIDYYLANPDARRALVDKLRQKVLGEHTYAHRATIVHDALTRLMAGPRFALRLSGGTNMENVAAVIRRELRSSGTWVRDHESEDKPRPSEQTGDDVVIHVSTGMAGETVTKKPDQVLIRLHLGTLDDISLSEAALYDAVLVADQDCANNLAATDKPTVALFDTTAARAAAFDVADGGELRIQDARSFKKALGGAFEKLRALLDSGLGRESILVQRVPEELGATLVSDKPVRVVYWPDYSSTNPYQRIVYAEPSTAAQPMSGTLDAALKMVGDANGDVVFHLHWVTAIMGLESVRAIAQAKMDAFLDKLDAFCAQGGKVMWTVHNLVSHEAPFPDLEAEMCNRIIALADIVHVHGTRVSELASAHYQLPAHKVRVAKHGNYIGAYLDEITTAQARTELGLPADARVLLFFGQIRAYKGIENLLDAFETVQADEPNLHLVIAGSPTNLQSDDLLDRAKNTTNVHLMAKAVPDDRIQVLMRAADAVVLPYRHVLTSGSLYLAMSFDRPVIAPAIGLIPDEVESGSEGLIYAADAPGALTQAVARIAKMDAIELETMQSKAGARARAATWAGLQRLVSRDAVALPHAAMELVDVDGTPRLCQIATPDTIDPPRVVSMVLHYGNFEDTHRCVTALLEQDYAKHHVIIISNDETAEAFAALATIFPTCTVIQSPDNLGYAGGNNIAIAWALRLNPDLMWIVNPDTIAEPDYLRRMIEKADLHPETSILGSLIVYGDRPDRVWFAGGKVAWEDGIECTHMGIGQHPQKVSKLPVSCDYITGASLFFRPEILDKIGYIPEEYFLYFEETHWCLAAEKAGLKLLTFPDVVIDHHKRSEDGGVPTLTFLYYYCRNALAITAAFHPEKLDNSERRIRTLAENWLGRVQEGAPDMYDISRTLVERGIEDGKAGRTGQVPLT